MKLPITIALAFSAFGWLAYQRLPRDIDPADASRSASVTAYLPGAHAADLERAVSIPIERALSTSPGVRDITTLTRDGAVEISFALDPNTVKKQPGGVADLVGQIRDRLDAIRPALLVTSPHLTGPFLNPDAGQIYDALICVYPPKGEKSPKLPAEAAHRLAADLRADPAIALAEVTGLPAQAVEIVYEDEDLADAGLTPADLAKLLRAQNFLAPGGYVAAGESKLIAPVSVDSLPDGIEALRKIPVRDPSDGAISELSDICEITLTNIKPEFGGVFSGDGVPTVAIVARRAPDAAPGVFAASINYWIEGNQDAFTLILRDEETDRRLASSSRALLFGAAAVFLCLTLCLGLRTGIAAAVALPVTVLTGCAVLQAFGAELNIVSLSAFALALGLLIDNHIVVAHRARLLRRNGLDVSAARGRTVRELLSPLIAAALTTVVGFLPAWLLRGGPGGYFADLFLVIAVLIAVSQIYGFTLTPALASIAKPHHRPGPSAPARLYLAILRPLLKSPLLGLFAVGALTAAAIPLLRSVPETSLPNVPTKFLAIDLDFPPGTAQETVAKAARDIALSYGIAANFPDENGEPPEATGAIFLGNDAPPVFRGMGFRPPAPHRAQIVLGFASPEEAALVARNFEFSAFENVEGATPRITRVHPISATPATGWPVALRISATDHAAVEKASAEALSKLTDDDRLQTAHPFEGGEIEKWSVVPDLESAAAESITPLDIAITTAAATGGLPAGSLRATDGGDPIPILLKAKGDDDPGDALEDAYVHRDKGDPVPLIDVAEVKTVKARASLTRFNSRPAALIMADIAPGANAVETERSLADALAESDAFAGVTVEAAGDSALADEANTRVLRHLPLVAVLIVVFLLTQTRSLRASIIILSAVPPALAGAALGLLLAGHGFGLMALLGMISLGGIVVNNAILLIDSIRNPTTVGDAVHAGDEPPPLKQRIASASMSRLVPVVLTAACAALGMAPLLVTGDPLWSPFVAAMVGGLAVATFITLFALPLLYALLFRDSPE